MQAAIFVLLALAGAAAGARPLPLNVSAPGCARAAAYASHTLYGAVVYDAASATFAFQPDSIPHAVASGSFLDASHTVSNFGQLRISTSGAYSDSTQTFGAGWLEGWLTAHRIGQNHKNLRTYFLNVLNASLDEPMEWIRRQDRWVRERCTERGYPAPAGAAADEELEDAAGVFGDENRQHRHRRHIEDFEDRVWAGACLSIRQFDGLVAGYAARAASEASQGATGSQSHLPDLHYDDFLFLESNADLYDIIDWLQPDQRPSWNPGGDAPDASNSSNAEPSADDAERLFRKIALSGKCSALVKVAADLSDIYMGHATWDSYTAMLRVYKHYRFDLRELRPAANPLSMSFSSYPGEVFSDDDFFVLSSGLVVLQTTNKIFNDELFEKLHPHSLLSWQRVRAAHFVASSGAEWTAALDVANSGTYNNQYMVVDLNKFTPGQDLAHGTLWVAEQIPGRVVAADMTAVLALGYWPSYNVPAFEETYNASGYPDFISKLEKYGQRFSRSTHWLSYETSPRAAIFRRDHASVDSLESMKALMRSNSYRDDPLSEGHPICAVCGRGDLDTGFPEARGCYDAKVTSWSLARKMVAEAVNGPTRGGSGNDGELPEFTWTATERAVGQDLVHEGQPERFAFEFERMASEEEVALECSGGDALAAARR